MTFPVVMWNGTAIGRMAQAVSAAGRNALGEARRQRMARELRKIAAMAAGEVYTLVFLGIHSGEWEAEATWTAQTLVDFSGHFGLGELDLGAYGNASLLPNGNWAHRAFIGMANPAQVSMALELVAAAVAAGLRIHVVAHSNGINAAAVAWQRTGAAVENCLILAPNTGDRAKVAALLGASARVTVVTSNADERLRLAPLARMSAAGWRGVAAAYPGMTVVETSQTGHGAQCYFREVTERNS
jgi:hypothetical protein